MRYEKPLLLPVGSALKKINSSLSKIGSPPDSVLGSNYQTSTAAYEADE
jgi:hypothetical protein